MSARLGLSLTLKFEVEISVRKLSAGTWGEPKDTPGADHTRALSEARRVQWSRHPRPRHEDRRIVQAKSFRREARDACRVDRGSLGRFLRRCTSAAEGN